MLYQSSFFSFLSRLVYAQTVEVKEQSDNHSKSHVAHYGRPHCFISDSFASVEISGFGSLMLLGLGPFCFHAMQILKRVRGHYAYQWAFPSPFPFKVPSGLSLLKKKGLIKKKKVYSELYKVRFYDLISDKNNYIVSTARKLRLFFLVPFKNQLKFFFIKVNCNLLIIK